MKTSISSVLHQQGLVAYRQGDTVLAIDLLSRALADPGRGKPSRAKGGARAAPSTPQAVAQMWSDLAEMQRSAGQTEAALASCQQALARVPTYPEAQLNLAAVLFQQRRFADAEAAVVTALGWRADWVPAMVLQADALREQGRIKEAEAAYRRVLGLAPNESAASTNLGWMLVQTGQMDEGLALCAQAAVLPSDDVLPLQNLGRVLLEYGRLDDAMAALEQALNRAPNLPELSLLIGRAWDELGDAGEARNWLGRALQLDDSLHEARVALASLEADLENHAVALELLNTVLQRGPARVDAHLVKARVRLLLGDVDGAVADHRAAIALQPESAGLYAALGNTLSSAGDIEGADGALAHQRRAIALNPRCVPAYSGLLTTLRHKAGDADRDAALALLDAPWMTDMRRSSLHFGLAAYYDGRSDWAIAAEHMVQANALRKAAESTRHHRYDPAQYEAFVDKLIATFTSKLFTLLQGLGSSSERPVFIVGMPRSGTTLTEQIIASHPAAFGAGERTFANQGLGGLPHLCGQPDASPLDCLSDLAALPRSAQNDERLRALLHQVAQWHLGQLAALDGGTAQRIADKMPDNFSTLGWLACLFPNARFIHCRRDLRDVALSCWVTNFAAIRWANDLDHLAHRIAQYQRLMAHWAKVLPVPVLEVDYEAMVSDQAAESRRLIAWLGLDWDERCLSFFKTERLVRTASVTQVREPIYKRSVARWKNYEAMLGPVLAQLGR